MEPQTFTSLSGALEVSKMIPFSRKTTRFYSDEAAFHFMGVVVDALFLHTDVICLLKGQSLIYSSRQNDESNARIG